MNKVWGWVKSFWISKSRLEEYDELLEEDEDDEHNRDYLLIYVEDNDIGLEFNIVDMKNFGTMLGLLIAGDINKPIITSIFKRLKDEGLDKEIKQLAKVLQRKNEPLVSPGECMQEFELN